MKMCCEICLKSVENQTDTDNDCILECLEKIKVHYKFIKNNYDLNKSVCEKLKLENEHLQKKIALLEEKSSNISPHKIRRKTHSPYELEGSKNYMLQSSSSPKELSDEIVTDLNQAMDITDVNWSESFFSIPENVNTSKECSELQTTSDSSPRKALSPLNTSKQQTTSLHSSNQTPLPKRLKLSISSKKEKHNENQIPENPNSKWILKKSDSKDLGMSFIQPQKTSPIKSKNISSPTTLNKSVNEKSRSSLSIKSNPKLRQTKLLFDIVTKKDKDFDSDETFCDDFVEPSPTSSHIEEYSKIVKKKNLSNFSRKKSDSNLFTFTLKPSNKSDLQQLDNIKREPNNTSKNEEKNRNFKKDNNLFNTEIQQSDSSSVIILPTKDDDVIIIDNTNTNYKTLDANDLIDKMLVKDNEFSTFYETIGIDTNIKDRFSKDNKENEKLEQNKEIDEILKLACPKCQEYFKYIGQNLSAKEIEIRIRNCKHKNINNLNQTPEGFWDPIFRPFPDDDSRNLTLIDDSLINK